MRCQQRAAGAAGPQNKGGLLGSQRGGLGGVIVTVLPPPQCVCKAWHVLFWFLR